MTRSLVCPLCIVLVLLAGSALAGETRQQKNIRFSIGPGVYHHEYTEPGLMENKGYFTGVAYTLTYENLFFASLDGLLSYGQVDYSSTSTGSIDGKDNVCADTRLLLGYVALNDGKIKMIPYAGIAYRYLSDDGEGRLSTTGDWAYLRESNYIYSPVGLMVSFAMQNGWSLHPSLEYDYFWAGTQKSHLGYQPGYEDLENDQNSGYGFRAAMGIEKQMPRFQLGFELFYRYWDIDRSEIFIDRWNRGWVEPANETSEIGVGVSFRF